MTRRRRYVLIAAVIVIAAIMFGPGMYRRYQVSYHRHRLQLAMEHKLAGALSLDKLPVVGWFLPSSIPSGQSESYWEFDQADQHRASLVELGELENERFVLKQLTQGTPEGRHFMRFLLKITHRLDVYWEGGPSSDQPVRLEFNFWCERGEMKKWRQFFARYDVPNYWEIRDQSVQLPEPVSEEL
jgi:hypothetical protein